MPKRQKQVMVETLDDGAPWAVRFTLLDDQNHGQKVEVKVDDLPASAKRAVSSFLKAMQKIDPESLPTN